MLGFRPGPARRRPRPYDLILDSVGLMLGRASVEGVAEGGGRRGPQLVLTESAPTSQVAPTDYGYSAQNPDVERTQPYEDFTQGFGLQQQDAFVDKRYKYTLPADLSTPFLWLKGPELTAFTPA